MKWLRQLNLFPVNHLHNYYLHERPVSADDEVWLGVLVDESGRGLEPLPGSIPGLEAVGDHPGGTRLQYCREEGHVRV